MNDITVFKRKTITTVNRKRLVLFVELLLPFVPHHHKEILCLLNFLSSSVIVINSKLIIPSSFYFSSSSSVLSVKSDLKPTFMMISLLMNLPLQELLLTCQLYSLTVFSYACLKNPPMLQFLRITHLSLLFPFIFIVSSLSYWAYCLDSFHF